MVDPVKIVEAIGNILDSNGGIREANYVSKVVGLVE